MMRRYNRLLVAFYVLSDAGLGMIAFGLAYIVRFTVLADLVGTPKGVPQFRYYLNMMPFVGIIVPLAFQVQGLYRLRRGRSRFRHATMRLTSGISPEHSRNTSDMHADCWSAVPR